MKKSNYGGRSPLNDYVCCDLTWTYFVCCSIFVFVALDIFAFLWCWCFITYMICSCCCIFFNNFLECTFITQRFSLAALSIFLNWKRAVRKIWKRRRTGKIRHQNSTGNTLWFRGGISRRILMSNFEGWRARNIHTYPFEYILYRTKDRTKLGFAKFDPKFGIELTCLI